MSQSGFVSFGRIFFALLALCAAVKASDAQLYLRVSEIMYSPPAPASGTNVAADFEFIELLNTSTNTSLNLTGVRLTNGIAYTFGAGVLTNLAPGARTILVRNLAAFTNRYGPGLPVAGVYTGTFNNTDERLIVDDALGQPVLECFYTNRWYPVTDGQGFSLVIRDEKGTTDFWSRRSGWRNSGTMLGNPGLPDPGIGPTPVVINEALTHTDPPQVDAIELFNPTTNAADIGGWFLTDDAYKPRKYRIPPGTTIPALGHLSFDENQFNNAATAIIPFRISSAGDDVWLYSADTQSNLTGHVHGWYFGASQNAVSFGRFINREGKEYFVQQGTNTLGTTNGWPRMWPAIITEIMFHPPNLGTNSNSRDEYIEITNLSASNTPCYDVNFPTNTWRISNGVAYAFATNITIPVGGRILIVGFEPTIATNLAAFRATYNLPTNIPVYGPWTGKLSNTGDTIELLRPDPPNSNAVPYILIEEVHYDNVEPWPTTASGTGLSIHRIETIGFGNDPYNWYPAPPTPGAPSNLTLDTDHDGEPDWAEWRAGTDPTNSLSTLLPTIHPATNGPGKTISWTGNTNRLYALERTTNITASGTYTLLQGPITGQPQTTWTDTTATNSPFYFYRLRIQP